MAQGDVVQSAGSQNAGTVSQIDVTLPGAVTVGNTLVAFMQASQFGAARTITPATGFTSLGSVTQNNVKLEIFIKVADGTGASFTFDVDGTDERHSGVIYEIEGEHTADDSDLVGATSGTTRATPSLTPSVLNCRALSAIAFDMGTGAQNSPSVSSGWTQDIEVGTIDFHSVYGASRNALTADTVTAISNTFTPVDNSDVSVTAIVLLAPVASVTLDQEGYRFRDDDGSESGATWLGAQDTPVSIAPQTPFRLRVLVNASGDPASASYTLQYRKVGDTTWKTAVT